MTKQEIQILKSAEEKFDAIKKRIKDLFKTIKDNAETMDGAYNDEQTVYEHIQEQFSGIHQEATEMAGDICIDILNLQIQRRKDAD